jgi:hypothetical protein
MGDKPRLKFSQVHVKKQSRDFVDVTFFKSSIFDLHMSPDDAVDLLADMEAMVEQVAGPFDLHVEVIRDVEKRLFKRVHQLNGKDMPAGLAMFLKKTQFNTDMAYPYFALCGFMNNRLFMLCFLLYWFDNPNDLRIYWLQMETFMTECSWQSVCLQMERDLCYFITFTFASDLGAVLDDEYLDELRCMLENLVIVSMNTKEISEGVMETDGDEAVKRMVGSLMSDLKLEVKPRKKKNKHLVGADLLEQMRDTMLRNRNNPESKKRRMRNQNSLVNSFIKRLNSKATMEEEEEEIEKILQEEEEREALERKEEEEARARGDDKAEKDKLINDNNEDNESVHSDQTDSTWATVSTNSTAGPDAAHRLPRTRYQKYERYDMKHATRAMKHIEKNDQLTGMMSASCYHLGFARMLKINSKPFDPLEQEEDDDEYDDLESEDIYDDGKVLPPYEYTNRAKLCPYNCFLQVRNKILSLLMPRYEPWYQWRNTNDYVLLFKIVTMLPFAFKHRITDGLVKHLINFNRLSFVYQDAEIDSLFGVCIYLQFCSEGYLNLIYVNLMHEACKILYKNEFGRPNYAQKKMRRRKNDIRPDDYDSDSESDITF